MAGAVGEQAERIVGGEAMLEAAGAGVVSRPPASRPRVHADEPGRAMADRVVLLVLDHLLVGQPGKIVVGLVVGAHMVEAVAVILAFKPAALGRRVKPRLGAALPLASRTRLAQQAILVGLDAQAVEEFRVELHGRSIMSSGG